MFFRRLNWNVVGWFRTVSAISYAFIIAGLLFMGYHWVKDGSPLRLGLSFTGGTDVTVKFKQPATKDAIANALASQKITDARINTLSKTGEPVGERWTIETQTDIGNNSVPFWGAMGTVAPVDRDASSISTVGPSLSHEYLLNAIKALVIAISIQFLYIAFRFGWNLIFGWVCVVALVRDSLMMIGIYAIAGRRVDDAFLAAVLTVIGYSVMDTIVILDRIRENVKLMDGKPFDEIVNTSILQTMTRSVNTLATVVITLVALVSFGGASLQNFAFALLVGICSGGYHSIFFSAPLVAVMQKRVSARTGRGIFGRSSLAGQPKTVAAARGAGGAAGAAAAQRDREAVAAARRARRELERQGASRRTTPPPRYKRTRQEQIDYEKLENRNFGAELPRKPELEPETHIANGEIDPLDAQAMGLHDEAAELGHEEIRLNLGDDEPRADGDIKLDLEHNPVAPEPEHKPVP
ncbi:MAG: preprotein translocase subunit SecF [Candidatus Eremiobacteraeota bacterium]|jgi:preprotein translocase SecF subunit|nr:preprotein translocase subunit SecF [Candidatus Eremiobacteraeota bacterium]